MPLTKTEWKKLEPKLRFRAFTVAKLGTAEEIEKAKKILTRAIKDGETYAATWQTVKETLNGKGTLNPNYWETVFRTNTQSAYIAGKLQKYQETNVKAFQLMVIEDSRTSPFCRSLLDKTTGYGMILPVNHQFWKTYGFPPYHFNCRTSICPVYGSMIGKAGYNVDNPSMNSFRRSKFKPQKGFGGNPLENGNWWMMTPSQMEQAIKYGILREFNRGENVFADYDSVWKGYKRHEGKNGGWYDLTDTEASDWNKNKHVVDFFADHGYKIKVLPEFLTVQNKYNIEWSNPDILLDGILTDIKEPDELSSNGIKSRLKKCLWLKSYTMYNIHT